MKKHQNIKSCMMTLLLCCLSLLSSAQKVSIHLKNASLKQVISAIEKQTNYRFSYRSGLLDNEKGITLNVSKSSVTDVLNKAIEGRGLTYSIISDKSIVITDKKEQKKEHSSSPKPKPAKTSLRKYSGVVRDNQGEPVIGATVMEKGTTNGVVTDLNGNFNIEARDGATFVVSYIGFSNQELKGSDNMDVTLKEDTKALDEVVVVGYGIQKKSSVTGAISSVKSEDLENRTSTNALQAIQGKTAGVNILSSSAAPGSSQSVRIRGISSNGSTSPLYVVDGRIADDISYIDPNDIASIEVLKDAASAAIYGAQAGNGVILLTTKKGAGKGTLSYNLQFVSQSLAKTPKVMNAEQYIDYYTERGNFTMDDVNKNWDSKTNTNWADVAFENSTMTRHTLTFSGGGEKGSFYLSASYMNNNGIVVGNKDKYQRITGMINASYKVFPWLEVGTNTQLEHYKASWVSDSSNSGIYENLFLGVLQLDPLTRPTYTLDELPENMRTIYDNYQAGKCGELLSDGKGNYYGISSFSSSDNLNPYILRDKSINRNRGFGVSGTTYINFTPFKGLTFTSRLGYSLKGKESYGVNFDYYANEQAFQNYLSVSGSDNTPTSYQWENFLNYYTNLGQHNINVMLGTSYSQDRTFGLKGSYTGGDGDLGFQQDSPLFWYFAYATPTATKELSGAEPIYTRKNSYFGRISWNYADRYYAQFSLRADAADLSVLPRKKRWGYFPAVSAGYVISNEKFLAGTQNWLSHLKVRASWGQNGSTASLSNYSWLSSITSIGHYPFSNEVSYTNAYAPSSTGNDELKWETSEQLDLGLDARFLRDRLSFTIDYFNKKTKDLIVSGIMPSTVVGNTVSPINAGDVKNSGVEIELGWQDNIGPVRYSIRGNLATIHNKVTYLHPSLADGINGTKYPGYATITKFKVGEPAWYYYGYKYTGVDPATGDPTFADLDANGSIGDGDKTYLGKELPDFTYGITLTAAWKDLDLIVFGSGSQGNDIFCCLNREDYAINKLTYFTEDRWSQSNPTGHNPRAAANDMSKYAVSSANVFDGSYFKIKQIQLGYNFPKSLVSKLAMSHLRAYVSLEDFFTFTHYVGFDPEITTIDMGAYPTSKKVVLGLNVTF